MISLFKHRKFPQTSSEKQALNKGSENNRLDFVDYFLYLNQTLLRFHTYLRVNSLNDFNRKVCSEKFLARL